MSEHDLLGRKAGISITPQLGPFAWFLLINRPRIGLNASWTPARWGEPTFFPVLPGDHHVTGHIRGCVKRSVGEASDVVKVQRGEVVSVRYLAPFFGRGSGRIIIDARHPVNDASAANDVVFAR